MRLPRIVAEPVLRAALLEDVGRSGDLTTGAIVPPDARTTARFVARRDGVVAGIDAALLTFELLCDDGLVALSPSKGSPAPSFDRLRTTIHVHDGESVSPGQTIAEVEGSARIILTGERTALNVLCRLSGIATATRTLVDLVAGTRAKITDTRKTTPGFRALEKYAVRCGGGVNHRFGLDDAVLIKDNHLAVAGSIRDAVAAVRAHVGHMVKVEIEVDSLEQLREALETPIDVVLLDNMSPAQLEEAVRLVDGRVLTEASGGVTPQTVAAIARTGVDLISSGSLTHSAPALDVGLDIETHG